MLEYIRGELTELTPAVAIVEANGIGYLLNISLHTFSQIQGKKEVKLFVEEQLTAGGRDDGFELYGFFTKQERELYRMLKTVSGVGGASARMILSTIPPADLCNVIATGDERQLKGVKGIGLKTAQRIIVDLRDRILTSGVTEELHVGSETVQMVNSTIRDEAVQALTMLGFSPAPTAKVVTAILNEQPDLPVEQVVKLALKKIK